MNATVRRELEASGPGDPIRFVMAAASLRATTRLLASVQDVNLSDAEGIDGAARYLREEWKGSGRPLPAWLAGDDWLERWHSAAELYGEALGLV